jgi:hypothetical protein
MTTTAPPEPGAPAPRPYTNPYLAGLGLGLALLAAFVLVGRGLGASGAFTRTIAAGVDAVAPDYAEDHPYWGEYTAGDRDPLDDFLVYQMLGMILGGMFSAYAAGRVRRTSERGPRISVRGRLLLAAAGGVLAGFGARLAGGCTSGLALTGGATLALSGWIFMLSFFAAGFAGAALVRRQWR